MNLPAYPCEIKEAKTQENTPNKKALNYQEFKYFQLCRSWIAISKDPMVRMNQIGNTFLGRVASHLKEDLPRNHQSKEN
ncbi:hypothetical protein VP01_359g8 [Puccinia sorghi]|uniref:Uncharacterized protein n=1 Tax=Puccinia sorghi TaxID=27349 RepID=A0A0L6UV37_9BASI|nr:hypothetical protein VP01_359g8 [Puccinia sorghi]